MIVIEAKLKGKASQYAKLDEAIRTAQFVRNSCLRYWEDRQGVTRNDLQKLCSKLAKNPESPWVKKLNSQARQSSADRAWQSISRFYTNCKQKVSGNKGYPKYKKFSRSVEYKKTGWRLSPDRKEIEFTDGFKAGKFELWTSRDWVFYSEPKIQRVRVVKRADGYYCQFLIQWERKESHEFQGNVVGIDLGLKEFYTDSNGNTVENPRYLRLSEARLRRLQRRVSKRYVKGKKQSKRYHKARKALARQHLKVSRQRKDKAIKDALALVRSNDLIVFEDLKINNLVKNHRLAKSISDASWYQFVQWLQYFVKIYRTICIAVPPYHTTVNCSGCGHPVQKTLSTRTHQCPKCGLVLDRDWNAARNILAKGLQVLAGYLNSTGGHLGTEVKSLNARGENGLWLSDRDIGHLSRLVELRTDNFVGNPPL
ncbi:RNA-guided endonuclease InsQ/TnpB family protein [Baaleninema simplex]|uniref:RNA-guided endonuclease InsQ/TnpB family protein n=1 Tax=Baaleninema simplex TaxID=2862350 RepID=UPI000476AB02|nr:RNA-guided endonuclease TnpB family protein [Baaleninema simplex]